MEIEKLDGVAVDVKNLDEAIKLFSDILGVTFVKFPEDLKIEETTTEHGSRNSGGTKPRVAMDRAGLLELIESVPPAEKEGIAQYPFQGTQS